MPNFYYTDANGQRGLINEVQLKALAVQGIITPNTPLETEAGHKGKAGQLKGLFATAPVTQTVPPNTTAQYFYVDENGQKQGLFNVQQLKELVAQGVITHYTPMETATGQKGLAEQIPDLFNQINIDKIYAFATSLMINEKQSATKTVDALVAHGVNAEDALVVVANIEQQLRTAKKSNGGKHMLYGALWCIGGTIFTAISYSAASESGGTFVLAWGAILFGGIQFLYGLFEYFTN